MELLKQRQYSPYPVEEQTVSIWAGTSGRLDVVPVDDVLRFEREFLDHLHREQQGLLDGIRESGDFSDDTEKAVTDAYDDFVKQFETSEGKALHAGHEEFEAMDHDEVEQEQIVTQKRG
jgi:F-type H+-transporting ATPase subunit alpha